jgi:hypothetical protein
MTDPLRAPGKTPRRAEPLQPDRPGRGEERLDADQDPTSGRSSNRGGDALEKQIEQSETALDNVRHP